MARNRVIYQSQALFIGPNSTGYHMQSGDSTDSHDTWGNVNWTGVQTITSADTEFVQGSQRITPTVTVTATAAASATSLTVSALSNNIPDGTVITFADSTTATTDGVALKGATSITVDALAAEVAAQDGTTASYNQFVTITVDTGASQGDGVTVTTSVGPQFALPSGTIITFSGGGILTLTADADADGDLTGNLTTQDVASAETATVYIQTPRYRTLIEPLHRIQSANFNFTINRQDVNEFGKLSRIDSIVMESPTVGLDFNYYITDGGNERKMGFNIPSNFSGYLPAIGRANTSEVGYTGDGCISGFSAISGLIEDIQGNNYYIVTAKEGTDVQGDTTTSAAADFDIISIGNGFISDYSIEASVGAIPTASVTVEAFNIRVDDTISGTAGTQVPGIDDINGQQVSTYYNFRGGTISTTGDYTNGQTVASNDITALRPGDLLLEFLDPDGDGTFSYDGFAVLSGNGKSHIQSFTVSIPMSRTILGRLGNTFGYARLIDLPLNIDVSVSAILSDLKVNNLFEKLDATQKTDFRLTLRRAGSTGEPGADALVIDVKGARLESESYSNSIGDNETVDISFSTQVGGSNDTANGIFMRGSYAPFSTLPYWPLGKKKLVLDSYNGTPSAP